MQGNVDNTYTLFVNARFHYHVRLTSKMFDEFGNPFFTLTAIYTQWEYQAFSFLLNLLYNVQVLHDPTIPEPQA